MRIRTTVAAIAIALLATQASGFGTISGLGQNREHERITRHALSCSGPTGAVCFQSASLDELAGKSGTWGAVGAPDNPARGLVLSSVAHCDNADYFAVAGYPQSEAVAQSHLVACRNTMNANMDAAVRAAARLLDAHGRVDDSQIPTFISCTYNGGPGRAKCEVLEDFGLVLHASQDFYAHSNWVDQPASAPTSLSNPPGLGHTGRAPWLDLRVATPAFPVGLITGCFDTVSIVSPSTGCPNHVKHEDLNKDKGQIDPTLGAGTTTRGAVDHNFAHAVDAAIDDTRDKWAILRERLLTTYGTTHGSRMICAITHDDPARTC